MNINNEKKPNEGSELLGQIIIKALKAIDSPRFFRTERGFQGRFACALYKIFDAKNIFPDDTVIEEEYQKRLKSHGIRLRPDSIIHVPVESGYSNNVVENNFVVFAFKMQSNEKEAKIEFGNLDKFFKNLNYQLGIFININGYPDIFLSKYFGSYRDRIHEFCIASSNGQINIRHVYFRDHKLVIKDMSKPLKKR